MDPFMRKLQEIQADVTRLRGTKYDRPHLMTVIVHHQRVDIGSCMCGWGVGTGDLGKSHAAHVLDVYELERMVGEHSQRT